MDFFKDKTISFFSEMYKKGYAAIAISILEEKIEHLKRNDANPNYIKKMENKLIKLKNN